MSLNHLEMVFSCDKAYSVRKQGDSHRYPVTIPTEVLNETSFENRQDMGFYILIDKTGLLYLVYTDPEKADTTISLSRNSSTGTVRVPGPLASILGLEDATVEWSVYKEGDTRTIVGKTSVSLSEVTNERNILTTQPLDHIVQDVEDESSSWTQEQFRIYLNTDMMAPLGWVPGQNLELSIMTEDGVPVICLSPAENEFKYKTQRATETGPNQADAIVNIPTAVVRSLRFVDVELNWSVKGDTLFARL